MKKSLIALAALAATASFAQSSVTISGNADVGYSNKEAINNAGKSFLKTSGVGDGLLMPNRIILTVQEDLGGGLKARFVNEHGISPTSTDDWGNRAYTAAPQYLGGVSSSANTNATTVGGQIAASGNGWANSQTNRGTYVALNGGFGEVRAGYLVSSFYNAAAQSGYLLNMEQYGGLLHTLGAGEVGGTRANGVEYQSPVWNGLGFTVQQQSGNERQATSEAGQAFTTAKAPRTALRLNYNNGPLALTFVNTVNKPVTEAAAAPLGTGVTAPLASTAIINQKNSINQLFAAYTFGDFKFTGGYYTGKFDDQSTANLDRKMKAMLYGVQYTTGPWTVYATGGKGTIDNAAASTTRINDLKQQQFGVKYALSKRTTAYAMIGESKDTGAEITAATGTNNIVKGKTNGLGLTHAF